MKPSNVSVCNTLTSEGTSGSAGVTTSSAKETAARRERAANASPLKCFIVTGEREYEEGKC